MCTSCVPISIYVHLSFGVSVYVYISVLEADVAADLAGGSGAGLGQEEPPIGADANLVDSLSGPRG